MRKISLQRCTLPSRTPSSQRRGSRRSPGIGHGSGTRLAVLRAVVTVRGREKKFQCLEGSLENVELDLETVAALDALDAAVQIQATCGSVTSSFFAFNCSLTCVLAGLRVSRLCQQLRPYCIATS